MVRALQYDAHLQDTHTKTTEVSKPQIMRLERTDAPPEYVLVSRRCGRVNEQSVCWYFQDSRASTVSDLVTVYLSQGESRRPSLPKWSAECDRRCWRPVGREGGLIYGPVAGQHLTYRGDMLVNEWANEAAELTTQDPSSKTHALCEPQTTDRVTQRKQRPTIALRMFHS